MRSTTRWAAARNTSGSMSCSPSTCSGSVPVVAMLERSITAEVYRRSDGLPDRPQDVGHLAAERSQRDEADHRQQDQQPDDHQAADEEPIRGAATRLDHDALGKPVVEPLLRGAGRRGHEQREHPHELDEPAVPADDRKITKPAEPRAEPDPAPNTLGSPEGRPARPVRDLQAE